MIVRPTIRGEARQVHPTDDGRCNCHVLLQWTGRGHLVSEGIYIGDDLAVPSDWIVKIGGEVRIVKAENFAVHYEEMADEEEV